MYELIKRAAAKTPPCAIKCPKIDRKYILLGPFKPRGGWGSKEQRRKCIHKVAS
jgi:hypothetical protein